MKFYLLYHPTKEMWLSGYSKRKYWTKSIENARKFNRRSDASNCRNTTHFGELWGCKVVEVEVTFDLYESKIFD